MASLVDSKPVFLQRARAIGLLDAELDKFVAAGVENMATLAFAANYVPGAPDDAQFVAFVKRVLGRP